MNLPSNEFARSQALRELNILDTTSDVRFDLITHFTSHAFNAPICAISLLDTNRQWIKSAYGIKVTEIPRNTSLCGHAIHEVKSNEPMKRVYEVSDTTADLRFAHNPYAADAPNIRAYIAYVIQSVTGENIGTLSIADLKPRVFTQEDKQLLVSLGDIAEKLVISHLGQSLKQLNSKAS